MFDTTIILALSVSVVANLILGERVHRLQQMISDYTDAMRNTLAQAEQDLAVRTAFEKAAGKR